MAEENPVAEQNPETEAAEAENPVVAAQIETALMQVAEMFGAVCHDPDNAEVARQADGALRELDALLAAAPG